MKRVNQVLLAAGILSLSAALAYADVSNQNNGTCSNIQCLSFSDDIAMDAAIFLADGTPSEGLKEAFLKVRKTDVSYLEKTDIQIAEDIIIGSAGRGPIW